MNSVVIDRPRAARAAGRVDSYSACCSPSALAPDWREVGAFVRGARRPRRVRLPLSSFAMVPSSEDASAEEQMYIPMKVVVVGDGAVGKTSMLLCYTTNTFPTDYMATVFDNYAVNVPYGAKTVNLGLWDTAGQEEYAQYRPLQYDQADGFILAFSLVDRASFDNVPARWMRELRAKAPGAPVVLVGTKLDLRSGEAARGERAGAASVVTSAMGEKMREKIGAAAYVECSALTQDNLKKVFDVAVDVNVRAKARGGDNAEKNEAPTCRCVVS